jgi:sulfur-oxidizing protein SoxB
MVDAAKLLGVDVMTGHWNSPTARSGSGDRRPRLRRSRRFHRLNVRTADFGDPVFDPYVIKTINGIAVAILGQVFPYVPIAHPRYFVPDWTSSASRKRRCRRRSTAAGRESAQAVVLSHNGMDVDLKLASRVTGIDVILGGHTHDGVPQPSIVAIAAAGRR